MALTDRSHFDLSHQIKTTCEMGELIPFLVQETVPGDSFRLSSDFLVRLQPMRAPIMQRISQHIRYYYVPYRILDENFKEMLIDPDSPLVVPNLDDVLKVGLTDRILKKNNLLRALGVTSASGTLSKDARKQISQYFFRAYYAIYNYYYRNPLLDNDYIDDLNKVDWSRIDMLAIRHASWYGDYLTEAKPSTQYGTEVDVDLDGNKTIKVNELRLAEKLQRYRDKLLSIFSGTGSRYSNYLKKMYGTAPSNTELSIPLYIGGASQGILMQDVDQTAPSEHEPVATTYSKSVTGTSSDSVQYDCQEHGLIIGLTYILPDVSYTAGVPRFLIKSDYYDFYNSLFANVGMQEVLGIELDASQKVNPNTVFGYQERYADLKYPLNRICGDFAEELDFYHMGRVVHREALSKDFLTAMPTTRIFSVESTEQVLKNHLYFESDNLDYDGLQRLSFTGTFSQDAQRIPDIHSLVYIAIDLNPENPQQTYSPWFDGCVFIGYNIKNEDIEFFCRNLINSGIEYDSNDDENTNHVHWGSFFDNDMFNYMHYKVYYIVGDDESRITMSYDDVVKSKSRPSYMKFADIVNAAESRLVPFVHNHVLMAVHNNVDALRPIPKSYNPSII